MLQGEARLSRKNPEEKYSSSVSFYSARSKSTSPSNQNETPSDNIAFSANASRSRESGTPDLSGLNRVENEDGFVHVKAEDVELDPCKFPDDDSGDDFFTDPNSTLGLSSTFSREERDQSMRELSKPSFFSRSSKKIRRDQTSQTKLVTFRRDKH